MSKGCACYAKDNGETCNEAPGDQKIIPHYLTKAEGIKYAGVGYGYYALKKRYDKATQGSF